MGWARRQFPISDLGSRSKNKRGYTFKLCPYSTEYRNKFRYDGSICTGKDVNNLPLYSTGSFVIGNSTDPDLHAADYLTYVCSDHTTTSGRMEYTSNPPGWQCFDPNCIYFTTVASGQCYWEV